MVLCSLGRRCGDKRPFISGSNTPPQPSHAIFALGCEIVWDGTLTFCPAYSPHPRGRGSRGWPLTSVCLPSAKAGAPEPSFTLHQCLKPHFGCPLGSKRRRKMGGRGGELRWVVFVVGFSSFRARRRELGCGVPRTQPKK